MAKYSFDSTIGELLDAPETFELFKELVPEAMDHPMLEVGRPFTLNQAMPFIEGIAQGMGIDNFEERVEGFRVALEALGD